MPDYKGLVEYIARRLVDDPENVNVSENRNSSGAVLVTINVPQADIGRIIGKRGSTINSIRVLVKASAVKCGDRVDVDIEEG